MPVQLAVVEATDRNGELVADFAAERPRLSKTQMVGVGRRAAAHQAWQGGNELAVVLVAQANGLGRHAARADVRLFCERCWGLGGIRIGSGRLGLYRILIGLRVLPRLLIAEAGQFYLKARFDQLGVCDCQRVLGGQAAMCPTGGIVVRVQAVQFGKQTISRLCGLFGG
jgi:hypothetical protein